MREDKKNLPAKGNTREKILLVMMPFWTPLLPPMGITCLKNYLQQYGYPVKSVDINVEGGFLGLYHRYFDFLKGVIPHDKKSNFYSIGQDVLRNHMLAYINYKNEKEYFEFLKILVFKTFYVNLDHHEVQELNQVVIDIFRELEDYFLQLLKKEKPALVGISVFRGTIAASLFGFRLTKKYDPRIKTVMGGGTFADQLALGSPNFEFFLKKTAGYIDKIIIGEGERLLLALLRAELPHSQRVFTLKDIHKQTLDISLIKVTELPDVKPEYYPYLPAFVSRGCPFNCSFCSETVRWGNYRKKNPRQAVEEILFLSQAHHRQLFLMTDSLLNPTIDAFSNELISSGASIYWDGYLRADKNTSDTERTLLWRRGGFYRARLGIESGSQRVLDLMNKKITPKDIKHSLASLAYAGIKTSTLWIIGHPGETEADFLATLELIKECKDYLYDAEGTPFWYFLTGQTDSPQWMDKGTLLYPESAADLLIVQEWIFADEPSREETYSRLNRFVHYCSQLGIPNPYSLKDIYNADQRWKKLHKNAVPALAEFNKNNIIDENKQVEKLVFIKNQIKDEGDFTF